MEIEVLSVGGGRDKLLSDLADRYLGRLNRSTSARVVRVPAASGRGLSGDEARRLEARRLREALEKSQRRRAGGGHVLVALDERGETTTSRDLAGWLAGLEERGLAAATFVVGGDEGLEPAFVASAGRVLSLSPMTLTHELAQVVLLEQLYRAWAIRAGHPYHRD
jgi:23S rRNA (pseudouridine1915-N3)-methyltransferase